MSETITRQQKVRDALKTVADYFYPEDPRNDVTRVSEILNVTEQYIYRWIKDGEVPGKWAVKMDRLTYGAVKRVDLNPSLFR